MYAEVYNFDSKLLCRTLISISEIIRTCEICILPNETTLRIDFFDHEKFKR